MAKDFILLEKERFEWSLKTFPEATNFGSLCKLREEIYEVELNLALPTADIEDLHEEFADCLMCLLDAASRSGVTVEHIITAFSKKMEKNKSRTWSKNTDNSYSHIK